MVLGKPITKDIKSAATIKLLKNCIDFDKVTCHSTRSRVLPYFAYSPLIQLTPIQVSIQKTFAALPLNSSSGGETKHGCNVPDTVSPDVRFYIVARLPGFCLLTYPVDIPWKPPHHPHGPCGETADCREQGGTRRGVPLGTQRDPEG